MKKEEKISLLVILPIGLIVIGGLIYGLTRPTSPPTRPKIQGPSEEQSVEALTGGGEELPKMAAAEKSSAGDQISESNDNPVSEIEAGQPKSQEVPSQPVPTTVESSPTESTISKFPGKFEIPKPLLGEWLVPSRPGPTIGFDRLPDLPPVTIVITEKRLLSRTHKVAGVLNMMDRTGTRLESVKDPDGREFYDFPRTISSFDSDSDPWEFDLIVDGGVDKGRLLKGICRLTGDELTIRIGQVDGPRPESFGESSDENMVAKRIQSESKSDPETVSESDSPQSTWQNSWQEFVKTIKGKETDPAFIGKKVNWSGTVKELEAPTGEDKEATVTVTMSTKLEIKDGERTVGTIDSIYIYPSETEWPNWKGVKSGDTIEFETTLGDAIAGGVVNYLTFNGKTNIHIYGKGGALLSQE